MALRCDSRNFRSGLPIFRLESPIFQSPRFAMAGLFLYNGIRAFSFVERIRLLLLIDYVLVRESLSRQLGLDPILEIVDECGAPAEGLEILSRSPVDVVLLDCDVVGNEAVRFISTAREAGHQGKILVLASEKDIGSLFRPLRAGASGIFLKHSSLDTLPRAIRQVAAGEAWVDLEIVQLLAGSIIERGTRNLDSLLTKREQQVLQGVVDGLTNKTIAGQVGISEGATKSILREVFRKAGVRTRSQLVRVALSS